MKTKALILFILFSLMLGACAPAGTPAGAGPDLSGKVVLAGPVSIVSASASPASVAYSYKCGTTFVPPVNITFTVLVDDPSNIGSEHLDVRVLFGFGSLPGPGSFFLLAQAGTTGTVHTYSDDTAENAPWTSKPMDAAFKTGAPGVFLWSASVADESMRVLARTDVMEIPFAPCKAPLVIPPVTTVMPPRVDVTIVPPGSSDKPTDSRPSCSVEPNNPNCKP